MIMKDCIFCKIILKEIPSHKIYEDENVYAFLDINPVHIGHTLVVPKVHAEDIFDISSESWAHVMNVVHTLSPIVHAATNADGVNIIMNNKRSAGQLIDHAHVHIVPRFADDGLKGLPQHNESSEALTTMQEKIKNTL